MAATAGDILLASLRSHGIEYFFANPGTDFPAIVEGFARAKLTGAKVPRSVLVPHENLAVAMAHGAYLMTGAPQAVMVHVNVGTANTINLLANAARDRVPLLLMAGRSPIMEAGALGRGAMIGKWRGGESRCPVGSVRRARDGDVVIGALVVVNAVGDVFGDDGTMLAGSSAPEGTPGFPEVRPFEEETKQRWQSSRRMRAHQARVPTARRERAPWPGWPIHPSHTRHDGDIAFAAATGEVDANIDRLRLLATEVTAAAVRSAVA